MRNLYQCRRGSVAFATIAALIPLIGFLARNVKLRLELFARTALPRRAIVRSCGISGLAQLTGGFPRFVCFWKRSTELHNR